MYVNSLEVQVLESALENLTVNDGEYVLILAAESELERVDEMLMYFREKSIECFGGLFPAVIYNNESYDRGAVLSVVSLVHPPAVIKGIDEPEIGITELFNNVSTKEAQTALLFVDGLTPHVAEFLKSLFNKVGRSLSYIGGGAGSLSLQQQPCLFTNEGIYQDAALIALRKEKTQLGVAHGWQAIQGPYVATKTERNRIIELNWEAAFPVYQQVIEQETERQVTRENFFDIEKAYPFGLMKDATEDVVRDPIKVNDEGDLVCVGEIPENTVLEILKGDPKSLIEAAKQASVQAISSIENVKHSPLVIDCISRVLFLGEDFKQELGTIHETLSSKQSNQLPVIGALTMGEISSYGDGYLEFFNKTTVVGVFHE
ncbi:MAG: FIST C-terminal domain-containing protein [Bacillaceae bacterium]|nr:FIST C-terminal domain-containing protein [Bacillaceae bacterium]